MSMFKLTINLSTFQPGRQLQGSSVLLSQALGNQSGECADIFYQYSTKYSPLEGVGGSRCRELQQAATPAKINSTLTNRRVICVITISCSKLILSTKF